MDWKSSLWHQTSRNTRLSSTLEVLPNFHVQNHILSTISLSHLFNRLFIYPSSLFCRYTNYRSIRPKDFQTFTWIDSTYSRSTDNHEIVFDLDQHVIHHELERTRDQVKGKSIWLLDHCLICLMLIIYLQLLFAIIASADTDPLKGSQAGKIAEYMGKSFTNSFTFCSHFLLYNHPKLEILLKHTNPIGIQD